MNDSQHTSLRREQNEVIAKHLPSPISVPPKKSDSRKGHGREKGWNAKWGSGNWKSLVPGSNSGKGNIDSRVASPRGNFKQNLTDVTSPYDEAAGSRTFMDSKQFMDSEFNSEMCIQQVLHSNSEEGVRLFYRNLKSAKEIATNDLKANVYKNYSEFVTISKEIAQLETDMLLLRGLFTDLRFIHENFKESTVSQGSSLNKDQSDPNLLIGTMDTGETQNVPLEHMHPEKSAIETFQGNEMQQMYLNVENADKVVPFNSKRALIHFGSVIELDNSHRFKSSVCIYVLSDVLLVAAKRRRGMKSRFVADKVWDVINVSVLDIKDTPTLSCMFKIVYKNAPYIFKCETMQEKKSWLSIIKRQMDDGSTSHDIKQLMVKGSTDRLGDMTNGGKRFAQSFQTTSCSEASMLDDLDVQIAVREFGAAVELIKRLKSHTDVAQRVSALSDILLRDLSNSCLSKSTCLKTMNQLSQLDQTVKMRDVFLSSRALHLSEVVRKLRFQGDLLQYVEQLVSTLVYGLKETSEIYKIAIPEPQYASFLVKWIAERLKEFLEAFIRQVADESLQIVVNCLDYFAEQIRGMRELGFDLEFLFWKAVAPDVARLIEMYEEQCIESFKKNFQEDSFENNNNGLCLNVPRNYSYSNAHKIPKINCNIIHVFYCVEFKDNISRSTVLFCRSVMDFVTTTKRLHNVYMVFSFASLYFEWQWFCVAFIFMRYLD
jgi:hypothetical protein